MFSTTTQRLVGVGESTHAAHHAEHVVVERIDADLRRARANNRVDGDRQLEGRLVNAGEVARAAGLVLLGAQREGVHVDTRRRAAAVVLEGLHLVEVGTLTLRETVLSVELELGDLNRVLALAADTGVEDDLGEQVVNTRLELSHTSSVVGVSTNQRRLTNTGTTQNGSRGRHTTRTRIGLSRRNLVSTRSDGTGQQTHDQTLRAEVVGVVERLGTSDGRNPRRVGAVHERVTLDDPEKLLDGVIEVQLDLVGRRGDGLRTSVLDLLNQVLVALLGEAAALLRVEVHVVNIEGGGGEGLGRRRIGASRSRLGVLAVLPRLEVYVHANLVILEGNQGDRKTRVAAEPELERNVERLGGGATARDARDRRLRGGARSIEGDATGALHERKVVGVSDERVERLNRARLGGQLSPDLHPVTILAVNALTTNLNLNLLDEAVTNVAEPAEALSSVGVTERAGRRRQVNLGEHNLNVGLVHQIGVTVDHSRHTLVEVRLTVEGHLNGLHGEVGMALVQHLPEGNLGVARDVNVLRTIAHELHKTTAHIVFIPMSGKIFSAVMSASDLGQL